MEPLRLDLLVELAEVGLALLDRLLLGLVQRFERLGVAQCGVTVATCLHGVVLEDLELGADAGELVVGLLARLEHLLGRLGAQQLELELVRLLGALERDVLVLEPGESRRLGGDLALEVATLRGGVGRLAARVVEVALQALDVLGAVALRERELGADLGQLELEVGDLGLADLGDLERALAVRRLLVDELLERQEVGAGLVLGGAGRLERAGSGGELLLERRGEALGPTSAVGGGVELLTGGGDVCARQKERGKTSARPLRGREREEEQEGGDAPVRNRASSPSLTRRLSSPSLRARCSAATSALAALASTSSATNLALASVDAFVSAPTRPSSCRTAAPSRSCSRRRSSLASPSSRSMHWTRSSASPRSRRTRSHSSVSTLVWRSSSASRCLAAACAAWSVSTSLVCAAYDAPSSSRRESAARRAESTSSSCAATAS